MNFLHLGYVFVVNKMASLDSFRNFLNIISMRRYRICFLTDGSNAIHTYSILRSQLQTPIFRREEREVLDYNEGVPSHIHLWKILSGRLIENQ